MPEFGQVEVEYRELPFNVYGVHDLALALARKVGVPESCPVLELHLDVTPQKAALRVTYFDNHELGNPSVVLQEFDLLARPISAKRIPMSEFDVRDEEYPRDQDL